MNYMGKNKRNIIILALVLIVGWGMVSRYLAYVDLSKRTKEHTLSVITITANPGSAEENVVLPANVQAWHETPIFARTNGYIKRWLTDIGAKVKSGDLIAEIDTPEVDAQLRQAEADLHTAEANNELAQVTAKRWVALLKTNSVSRQEADEKVSDAKAKEALMLAARANVNRLEELEGFKRITAPFDGIITARNIDNGDLINSGNSATLKELFHVAEIDKLRVYVQVPQTYAISLKPGYTAEIHLSEFPGKEFTATLLESSGAIDPVTRTLLLEFELDNTDGSLMSGSYAEVHLKLPVATTNIMMPVNVLLFRPDGMKVATVGDDNKVALKKVSIHRDFGNQIEVDSGINTGDKIIVNPLDSLEDGQEVKIIAVPEKSGNKDDKERKKDGDSDKKDKAEKS